MLLGLVTIPYLIDAAGVEAIGILTLIWSLIGYFSVFDFGIGRALTQQVSMSRASGLDDALPGLVKVGVRLMLATGLAGAVTLSALAYPLGHYWLNVSPYLRDTTSLCLLVTATGIPVTTVTSGLKGLLEGCEDFRASSILRLLLGILNFGLPALAVITIGPSLLAMTGSLVLGRVVILLAHVRAIDRWVSVRSIVRAATQDMGRVMELLRFGAWMTLSNIVSPLMVTADRFVISFALGASVVAYYTVPFDAIVRLLVIPAALTGALFPRFTHLFHADHAAVRALYNRSHRVVLLVMTGIAVTGALLSRPGLTIWLGADFASQGWVVASIICIGVAINSVAQVPHATLQAAGDVRTTALIHVAEFLAYLPLLLFSLELFGLVGAAVTWVLRSSLDYLVLSFFARRRMT